MKRIIITFAITTALATSLLADVAAKSTLDTSTTSDNSKGWCLQRPKDPLTGRKYLSIYEPEDWKIHWWRKVRIFDVFDTDRKDETWAFQKGDQVKMTGSMSLIHSRPSTNETIEDIPLASVGGKYLYGVAGLGTDSDPLRHIFVFYHGKDICSPKMDEVDKKYPPEKQCRFFSFEVFVDGDQTTQYYRPDQISDKVTYTYDAGTCPPEQIGEAGKILENNGGSGGEPPP
jgi:hypothetical protein